MELKAVLEKLEKNDDFVGWKKIHEDSYFSYALKTIDEKAEQPWQFGYFNPKSGKMVTFLMDQDNVEMQPEEEVFKKPEMDVKPIDIKKMSLSFKDIMEKAESFCKEEYPKEIITKKIVILQDLEEFGTIWNLTMISQSFNTINIKLGADKGEVLHHSCENFMNFIKKE